MIIATAGHVDHGKTSLVRRLTGIDTDRLPEEQRRGMTIDLGFAYVDAFGTRVGFVDVPGHERFVHNMLVGASGIDLALIVVAADDGVMPQTIEHVQILEVLGVTRAIVVVTKIDRATATRVAAVCASIPTLLAGTAFEGASVLCLSSTTGEGLHALQAHLQAVVAAATAREASAQAQLFRLAIDRVFTVAGTGTVVTGYVHAGACAVGDELLLWPRGERVRIRGIHANDRDEAQAVQGQRAALALAGVDRASCTRGDWLLDPACALGTTRIVGRLHASTRLPAHRDWLRVHLHSASSHALARVHAWQDAEGRSLAELRLDSPLPFVHGDRFVLRDDAAQHTLGGGMVLDPSPPARGLTRPDYHAQLAPLFAVTPQEALAIAARGNTIIALAAFRQSWNLPEAALAPLLEGAGMQRTARAADALAITTTALAAHEQAVADTVDTWHKANAHVRGIRPDQLRAVLRARVPAHLIGPICERMIEAGMLQRAAGFVQRPGHAPRISADDRALWLRLEPLVGAEVRPPVLHDIARRLPMDIETLRTALRRLAFAGLVVQVADNRFFLATQVEGLMQVARALDAEAAGDGFLATRFRDETALGRNLAIDVLEHFDSTGFTVRRGDRRIVSRVRMPRGGRGTQTAAPAGTATNGV